MKTTERNRRFSLKNPDRIMFLAKLYFDCEVKKIPRNDMAESLKMPPTTLASIFTKHINHLAHDIDDQRYSMFYEAVRQIAEKENHAIDLIPPSKMVSFVITEQPKEPVSTTPLLIRRMNLAKELDEVNTSIICQIDFILESMNVQLLKLHEGFDELTDALTVKQYRTKDYPSYFIFKINVIIQRVNIISDQYELITQDDLQTDTALIRNKEIRDTLNILTEKYNALTLKSE